jgi:hypothetical protein
MIKTRFAQFALLAGLAAMSATVANASVTKSYSVSGNIATDEVSFDSTINLPKFNVNLGTLQNVVISFDASGTVTADLANNNKKGLTEKYAFTQHVDLTVSGGGVTATGTLVGGPYSGTLTKGSTVSLSSSPVTIGASSGPVANLAPFRGNGTTTIALSFTASSVAINGSTGSGVTYTPDAFAGALVKITYTYTHAVPEPGTVVALASGLVCLGLVRLRRRKSA